MSSRKKAAVAPSNSGRRHEPATAITCRLFQLPQPLIMDILSRLLIKDLVHCKCVCKSFLCLISDPGFARLHLSRSPLSILFKTSPPNNPSTLAHVDIDAASFEVSKLVFTPKSNVPTNGDIFHMSACNGLLLFLQKGGSFYVCNPILGEFITIQPAYKDRCRGNCTFGGLGYSTVTNQYKVLQTYCSVESANRCLMAEIYTIGTGSWRSIGNAPTNYVLPSSNAFLNGALHWSNISPGVGEFIHSFDFDAEQFGRVPLPDQFLNVKQFRHLPKIGVIGGCLFMIRSTNSMQVNIWVMKEYGVKESWTNQFVIEGLSADGFVFYQPMAVSSDGDLLILYKENAIVGYNLKRKQLHASKFFQTYPFFFPVAYNPCFVSLYAKGEKISRLQSTGVYDKICKDEFLWP